MYRGVMVYYAAVYVEFLVSSEILTGIFSPWKKGGMASYLKMPTYWGFDEATSANGCHLCMEIIELRLNKEGSILFIMLCYTWELLPLNVSCNKPLQSVMKKHWNKWVMDR